MVLGPHEQLACGRFLAYRVFNQNIMQITVKVGSQKFVWINGAAYEPMVEKIHKQGWDSMTM